MGEEPSSRVGSSHRIMKVKDEPEDPSDLYALSHDDEGKGQWGRWSAHQHRCARGHPSPVGHVKHRCRFVLQETIKLATDTRSTFGLRGTRAELGTKAKQAAAEVLKNRTLQHF